MSDKEREATEYPVKAMQFIEAYTSTIIDYTPQEVDDWWAEWVEEMKNDDKH